MGDKIIEMGDKIIEMGDYKQRLIDDLKIIEMGDYKQRLIDDLKNQYEKTTGIINMLAGVIKL